MLRQVQSDRPRPWMAPIRCCFDQTAVWHSDAARGPSTPSFNHLVGKQKERFRDREPKCLRGLEVDGQLEFDRLLHGQVGGLGALAAACNSSKMRTLEALSGFQRQATRETVGIASLRSCSRLAPRFGPKMLLPVIFPPGRAMPGTSPTPTGSPIAIMTMGIVIVACLAAKLAGVP